MPTPEELFDGLAASYDEHHHDHGLGGSSPSTQAGSIELLTGASNTYDESIDPDRAERMSFGPHEELWAEQEDPSEQQAREKAARLEAAGQAADELDGEADDAVKRCVSKPPNAAIEVVVVSDDGPVAGALVELRRKDQQGILASRSGRNGKVRFEGLLAADAHQVRLLGCGRWSVQSTEALAGGLEKSQYDATWATPPASSSSGKHTVAQGECLWTLAMRLGYDPQALWEANSDLTKDERVANVLAPDDVVLLSEGEPTLEDVRTGQRAKIHCVPPKAKARIRFQDEDGKARSGIEALVVVTTREGTEQAWNTTTNGDGAIDEEVPAEAATMEVTLATEPEPEVYHFRFAFLDPLVATSGVQGRLLNLGFSCGSERGEIGPLTRRALREFQSKYELTESGEIDDATRSKLTELYEP